LHGLDTSLLKVIWYKFQSILFIISFHYKKNWNYRRNFIDGYTSVGKFELPTDFTDGFSNFNYRRKNPSVKKNSFINRNSNFFYRQIYRQIFPSVKEAENFSPKFELPTDLQTKKSVGKRSGKFFVLIWITDGFIRR